METSSGESTPRRHSRHGSTNRANLPRRSTRGPLDAAESPLPTNDPLSQPPKLPQDQSSLLSPTASQYAIPPARSPRLPSPQPGSNLSMLSSNPSFKTAHSNLSPRHSTLSPNLQKDFSFLLRPEIYHPLTRLDVPPPFRTANSQISSDTPLQELAEKGHFRSAAIKAAQLLTTPGSVRGNEHERIFELVYIRLSCLTLCNQTALAAQEVKALEDLTITYYRDDNDGTHLVPWELRVLAIRLQGMGFNDARRGVMGYYDLAREARLILTALKKPTVEGETDHAAEIALWESRLSELGIRVASALVEMEDFEGATRFLSTLKPSSSSSSPSVTARLQMQKSLLWLCLGDVEAARACIATSNTEDSSDHEEKIVLALAHMADADHEAAAGVWEDLITGAAEQGEKAMYRQNLGVCLLYLGRMDKAREILETLIDEGNNFHALTFNLSTIYELCTERSRALKIGLAEKVAGIQESGEKNGWEKVNGDFKL